MFQFYSPALTSRGSLYNHCSVQLRRPEEACTTIMNVYQRLCTPFLEALCDDRAFDINIPGLVDDDLEGLLDLEADNDDEVDNNQVRKATKRFADGRTCRAYAQIMAVAAMILELKSVNRSVSLRDVYYALKSLFKNQRECNACILQVGRILNMKRHEMNIVPAAKGFVSGPLRFRFHDAPEEAGSQEEEESQPMDTEGEGGIDHRQTIMRNPNVGLSNVNVSSAVRATGWVSAFDAAPTSGSSSSSAASDSAASGSRGEGGEGSGGDGCCLVSFQWTSTPTARIEVEWTAAGGRAPRFLVVVEKEGVFHRLVEERFSVRTNCVLVTGCGYPDMATRALVSKLSSIFPEARVVGLCDYNPHGVALLLSYRFASAASAYESQGLQANIRWLGLRATHIREFLEKATTSTSASSSGSATSSTPAAAATAASASAAAQAAAAAVYSREQLQALSPGDDRKIRALLAAFRNNSYALPDEYEAELRDMLLGGVKCEIECCYGFGLSFLPNLLERCLNNGDYI